MAQKRQRLAWIAILLAFMVCAVLAAAVPLISRAAVFAARQSLPIFLEATQGRLGVLNVNAENEPDLMALQVRELDLRESVLTNENSVGFLRLTEPDGEMVLAEFQILPNSNVQMGETADTPRYSFNTTDSMITASLIEGRVRVKTADYLNRTTSVLINTPQGQVNLTRAGSYTLEIIRDETYVEVERGEAQLLTTGDPLTLNSDEAGRISDSQIAYLVEQNPNLLQNSDFNEGLGAWEPSRWNIERSDQPIGEIGVFTDLSDPRLKIERDGIGAAKVSLSQSVQADVSTFDNLFIELSARINNQFIPVCGVQGSECPLTVRIEYLDDEGQSFSWQQGFFADGEVDGIFPDANLTTPGYCPQCALPRLEHQRMDNIGAIYYYKSPNLFASLDLVDLPRPEIITSVIIVTEGHQFSVELFDISLEAQVLGS